MRIVAGAVAVDPVASDVRQVDVEECAPSVVGRCGIRLGRAIAEIVDLLGPHVIHHARDGLDVVGHSAHVDVRPGPARRAWSPRSGRRPRNIRASPPTRCTRRRTGHRHRRSAGRGGDRPSRAHGAESCPARRARSRRRIVADRGSGARHQAEPRTDPGEVEQGSGAFERVARRRDPPLRKRAAQGVRSRGSGEGGETRAGRLTRRATPRPPPLPAEPVKRVRGP